MLETAASMSEPNLQNEPPASPATIGYREFKLMLCADQFDTPARFHKFWKLTRRTAEVVGVEIAKRGKPGEPHLREVLYFDTPRFRLYNHGFILRQRTFYRAGLRASEHELTVKYRGPDYVAAAAMQMHPRVPGLCTVKFKEEVLVDQAKIGSHRSIYAQSAELETTKTSLTSTFGNIAAIFPVLISTGAKERTALSVVNGIAIEEILVNMGEIDFGGKVTGKATLAIWRNRTTQQHLVGEYSYQIKIGEAGNHGRPKELSEAFFGRLQIDAADWLYPGTTKTAMVYGLGRAAAANHE
jgi:hypothetical protein